MAKRSWILASRCIDRPIRPLFPKDLRNDCTVIATVMSVDPDCSPEVAAAIGVSTAIAISDIPWDGPISSVQVGLVDGEIVINPTFEQRAASDLKLTVSSTEDLVAMIEAGGNEISEDVMFDAIMAAHEANVHLRVLQPRSRHHGRDRELGRRGRQEGSRHRRQTHPR